MIGLIEGLPFASLDGAFLVVLGDAAVKICVISPLAVAATVMLHRSSAAMRHMVWTVAMLSFVLTPVLSSTVPKWQVLPNWLGPGYTSFEDSGKLGAGLPGRTNDSKMPDSVRPGGIEPAPVASAARSVSTLPIGNPPASGSTSVLPTATRLACATWFIGFVLLVLRTVTGRLILSRVSRSAEPVRSGTIREEIHEVRRRLGIGRRVDARLSAQRGTPMTWGLLRVQILLPAEAASWKSARLRAVLLHEFAHVKRHDTITHVFTQIVCAFYWFHPLVWGIARRLRVECEHACDDLVLESGVKASDYAAELLGILVPRTIPCTALAMTGGCDLENRVRSILDERLNRRSMTRRVVIAGSLAAVLPTAGLASLQASNPPASPAAAATVATSPPSTTQPPPRSLKKVTVTCVDSDGKPVAGAEVHLFQFVGPGHDGRYVHTGPFTSDEHGKAACSDAVTYDGGNHDRWYYVRVPGRLVGVGRSAKWTNSAAINPECRVTMQASQTVDGRITVPAGFDPTKVTVRVRTLHVITGPGVFDYNSFPREDLFPGLDTALPDLFECSPDPDGRIRFSDVPARGHLYLVSTGVGLAEAQWSNVENREGKFDQPIRMAIEEEGVLSGHVLSPDGKPAAGLKVTARLSTSGRRRNSYLSSFHAVTGGAGEFSIHGLPQTEFDLRIVDPTKAWAFRPLENLLVPPHQDPKLRLKMEVGVVVSGKVVTPDGQPLESVGVSAVVDDRGGPGLSDQSTDARGRYEMRLPAGDAYLYINGGFPDSLTFPDPRTKHIVIKSAEGDLQDLDFILQRRSK